MTSSVTRSFQMQFRKLPAEVKKSAAKTYGLWRDNPRHPGLQYKRISQSQPVYSIRIGIGYRALGLVDRNHATWFWIGTHAEYDTMIRNI